MCMSAHISHKPHPNFTEFSNPTNQPTTEFSILVNCGRIRDDSFVQVRQVASPVGDRAARTETKILIVMSTYCRYCLLLLYYLKVGYINVWLLCSRYLNFVRKGLYSDNILVNFLPHDAVLTRYICYDFVSVHLCMSQLTSPCSANVWTYHKQSINAAWCSCQFYDAKDLDEISRANGVIPNGGTKFTSYGEICNFRVDKQLAIGLCLKEYRIGIVSIKVKWKFVCDLLNADIADDLGWP